jgi:hypothetical protein
MAAEKENILVEMRAYHEVQFNEKVSSVELDYLIREHKSVEEKIFSGIMGQIFRREEFVDATKDLTVLEEKLKKLPTANSAQVFDKELFKAKIDQLFNMIKLAKKYPFKPKRPGKA